MGYTHPLVLKQNIALEKKYHLWLNEWTYYEYRNMLRCESKGIEVPPIRCSNYMPKINSITYKTPDYMLSCAQDFRKGKHGYQQHIWQATLDGIAIVFTNHPGSNTRPGYWAGNEIMPKAVQYKNTLIAIYDIKNAEDPEDMRKQKVKEYKDKFANPYVAAAYGYVDAVIEPDETRKMLIHALDISEEKRIDTPIKKHGIPPF